MPRSTTRRTFLKTSAASLVAPCFVPAHAFGANERLNIAAVGVGGKGKVDIANAALFLTSDEAGLVTGFCMEIDGGRCI